MPPADAPQDAPRLIARFLDEEAESGLQNIDLTHWLDRPQIAHALHGYFLANAAVWNVHTRDTQVKHFKVFKSFLDEWIWDRVTGLGDITSKIVFAFENWLDEQKRVGSPKDDIEAGLWTGLTKICRYGAVVQFLDHCWRTRSLRQHMVPDLAFRRNPWPRAHHDVNSHEPLTREELHRPNGHT